MTKLSSSPERYSFQLKNAQKRAEQDPDNPDLLDQIDQMAEIFRESRKEKKLREQDPEWQKNNLEYQLRSTSWILEKVRGCNHYAQNLYAAMCNNDFFKTTLDHTPENVTQILTQGLPRWSCSWRYAGGIIADMQGTGDYIDWYCSGIRDPDRDNQPVNGRRFVAESVVTDEIREDILRLGWRIIQDD